MEVEATKEERDHADRIAKEIEKDSESKRRALLENDDEERDLDKETVFDKDGGFESVPSKRGVGRLVNLEASYIPLFIDVTTIIHTLILRRILEEGVKMMVLIKTLIRHMIIECPLIQVKFSKSFGLRDFKKKFFKR